MKSNKLNGKKSLNLWILCEERLAWQDTAPKLLPDGYSLIFKCLLIYYTVCRTLCVFIMLTMLRSLQKTRGFMVFHVFCYVLGKGAAEFH